jgi:hypothetical protein
MLKDEDHEHYFRPENEGELQELIQFVSLYEVENEKWHQMYKNIRNCTDMFGYKNISLYFNENMKWGDGIEEFLNGFWINLREADYSNGEPFEFYKAKIMVEKGFLFVQSNIISEEKIIVNNIGEDKTIPEAKTPATKAKTKKERMNLDIFNIKNYNGMDILFHESCGMAFNHFEYSIPSFVN